MKTIHFSIAIVLGAAICANAIYLSSDRSRPVSRHVETAVAPSADRVATVAPKPAVADVETQAPAGAPTPADGTIAVADDGTVTINVNAFPLSLLTNKLEALTGVRFYLDDRLRDSKVTLRVVGAEVSEAMKRLSQSYNHADLYHGESLAAISLYPREQIELTESLLFLNASLYASAPAEAVDDNPVTQYRTSLLSATPDQVGGLFDQGLQSSDADTRAMALSAYAERGEAAPFDQLSRLARLDPSPLVRAIAFNQLMSQQDIDVTIRRDLALAMQSDSDPFVKEQATAILTSLSSTSSVAALTDNEQQAQTP
ncbi:hypothetical protein HCH_03750 [Hahella chejuensis KCTC 2396]|uniref:Uncharacterized protein n=1 Tax=Hahella chejuensis (strain KCTC 2396) TaxID=349521 RepID=Q2SFU1_HAHCH|nr:hypothetical protein [Hahella chejuensis]ABC30483.1 hypothetical protein HCH_03750 [Hahella chejuensis KCTC 2396]